MLLFHMITLLFEFSAIYLAGLIVGGTILGAFPISEIYSLVVSVVMWFLAKGIRKLLDFTYPVFLNTKRKRIIAVVLIAALGVLSSFGAR